MGNVTHPKASNENERKEPLILPDTYIKSSYRVLIKDVVVAVITMIVVMSVFDAGPIYSNKHSYIILPRHSTPGTKEVSNLTLRDILDDPDGYHLALAPAFFGFYGYFGALIAWEESMGRKVLQRDNLLSVAGASAGAMTAVLLAAGISPQVAADFCSSLTVDQFADVPGVLALFRGSLFEGLMSDFLFNQTQMVNPNPSSDASQLWIPQVQEALIPVAVSAFDVRSLTGHVIRAGSMARAARASASFPLLFQPVAYPAISTTATTDNEKNHNDYLFLDGGITDPSGIHGTQVLLRERRQRNVFSEVSTSSTSRVPKQRDTIINMSVGGFLLGAPPGPSHFHSINPTVCRKTIKKNQAEDDGAGVQAAVQVVSISVRNLPRCGPWAMKSGAAAVRAATVSMRAAMDVPLSIGLEPYHYELHIDTAPFWKNQ